MARTKYAIECPVCGNVMYGYTHVQADDNLRTHVYRKHPALFDVMRDRGKENFNKEIMGGK